MRTEAARMVSRRKILSRSRDDLNIEAPPAEEEEDIWYNKDKLYKVSQTVILVNKERITSGIDMEPLAVSPGGLWSF